MQAVAYALRLNEDKAVTQLTNTFLRRRLLARFLISMAFLISASILPACAQLAPAGEAQQAATQDPAAIPTITMTGLRGEQVPVTAADIAIMTRHTIAVFNTHTQVKENYGGVLLSDVLAKIQAPLGKDLHGKGLGMYLIAEGADHYKAVYSLAEVDPAFHPGSVLIADTLNGQVLPAKQGPLQLINTEDKRPARWVHQLTAIHLVAIE